MDITEHELLTFGLCFWAMYHDGVSGLMAAVCVGCLWWLQ